MIAPDGRKVPVVYLDPRMLTEIAIEALRAHQERRTLVAAAVDGRVFFQSLDDIEIPKSLRDLWKRQPGLMIPESAGYRTEDEELQRQ